MPREMSSIQKTEGASWTADKDPHTTFKCIVTVETPLLGRVEKNWRIARSRPEGVSTAQDRIPGACRGKVSITVNGLVRNSEDSMLVEWNNISVSIVPPSYIEGRFLTSLHRMTTSPTYSERGLLPSSSSLEGIARIGKHCAQSFMSPKLSRTLLPTCPPPAFSPLPRCALVLSHPAHPPVISLLGSRFTSHGTTDLLLGIFFAPTSTPRRLRRTAMPPRVTIQFFEPPPMDAV